MDFVIIWGRDKELILWVCRIRRRWFRSIFWIWRCCRHHWSLPMSKHVLNFCWRCRRLNYCRSHREIRSQVWIVLWKWHHLRDRWIRRWSFHGRIRTTWFLGCIYSTINITIADLEIVRNFCASSTGLITPDPFTESGWWSLIFTRRSNRSRSRVSCRRWLLEEIAIL